MKSRKNKNLRENNQGFTILEVLIAIGIFSVGIVGISSLMLQSMQAESLNAGYLKASMLAQEGLEMVRFARDENWLDPLATSWDMGFGDTDGTFTIDYDLNINDTPNLISDTGTILRLNGNFYDHNPAGLLSSYRRLITVSVCAPASPDCWKVQSRVDWGSQARTNTYVAETLLYNWR